MIIEVDFLDHWKTRLLVNELDGDELAPTYLIRLWAHCQIRVAGTFRKLSADALKAICRFSGDASKFDAALCKSGYVSRDGDKITVVGWADKNKKMLANKANGKRGGRPRKGKPINNPTETQGEPNDNPNGEINNPQKPEEIRVDEIRVDKKRRDIFVKPTVEQVREYCQERTNSVDAQRFVDHYESNGWKVGKNAMKDWRASVRTWEKNEHGKPHQRNNVAGYQSNSDTAARF
jgi:hypothetical protein